MPFQRKVVVAHPTALPADGHSYAPHQHTLSSSSAPSFKTLADGSSTTATAVDSQQSLAHPARRRVSHGTTVSESGKSTTSFRKKKNRSAALAAGTLDTTGSSGTWVTMSTAVEDTGMDDMGPPGATLETVELNRDPSADSRSVMLAVPPAKNSGNPNRITTSSSDAHVVRLTTSNRPQSQADNIRKLHSEDDTASTQTTKKKKKEKKEKKERKKEKKDCGRRHKEHVKIDTLPEQAEDGRAPLPRKEVDVSSSASVDVAKDISHAVKQYIRKQSLKFMDATSRGEGTLPLLDGSDESVENMVADILGKKAAETTHSSFKQKKQNGDTRPSVRITDWTESPKEVCAAEFETVHSEDGFLEHPLDPSDDLNDPRVRYSIGGSVYTRQTVTSGVKDLGEGRKLSFDDSVEQETSTMFSPSGATTYGTIVDELSSSGAKAKSGSSQDASKTVPEALHLDLGKIGSKSDFSASQRTTGPMTSVSEGPTVFEIFSDGDESPVDGAEVRREHKGIAISEMMEQLDVKTAESLAEISHDDTECSGSKAVFKEYKTLPVTGSCVSTLMRPCPVVVKDEEDSTARASGSRMTERLSNTEVEDRDASSPSSKEKSWSARSHARPSLPYISGNARTSSEPHSPASKARLFRARISNSVPLACYGSLDAFGGSPMESDRDWSMTMEKVFIVHGIPMNVTVTVPSLDVKIGVIHIDLNDREVDLSWNGESLKIHNVLLEGPSANEWFGALSSLRVIVRSDDDCDAVELFSHVCFVERLQSKGANFCLKPYWKRLSEVYKCHPDPLQICQAVVLYNSFTSSDISGSVINLAIKTPQRMNQLRGYVLRAFEHYIFSADSAIDGIRAIEGIIDFEFPTDLVEGILAVVVAIADLYAEEDHGVAVTVMLLIHKLLALHPEEEGVQAMKDILAETTICATLENALSNIDDPEIHEDLTQLKDFVHPGFFAGWSFW